MGIEIINNAEVDQLRLIAPTIGTYYLMNLSMPDPFEVCYIGSRYIHSTNYRDVFGGISMRHRRAIQDDVREEILESLASKISGPAKLEFVTPHDGVQFVPQLLVLGEDGKRIGEVYINHDSSMGILFDHIPDSDEHAQAKRLDTQIRISADVLRAAVLEFADRFPAVCEMVMGKRVNFRVELETEDVMRAFDEQEELMKRAARDRQDNKSQRESFVEKVEKDILQRWDFGMGVAIFLYKEERNPGYRQRAVGNIESAFEMLVKSHEKGLAERTEEQLASYNSAIRKLRDAHSVFRESAMPLDVMFAESLSGLVEKLEAKQGISRYPLETITGMLEKMREHGAPRRKVAM